MKSLHLPVISHFQAAVLLEDRRQALQQAQVSLDLGLGTSLVSLNESGVLLPDAQSLDWEVIQKIARDESSCFFIQGSQVSPIQFFSRATNRAYSLYPTQAAPTMLISGIPMHRIKDTDPHRDTLEKIRAVKPIVGNVLDTATGLGYTAIEAAKTAEHVTTIELDPTALQVAQYNPWSSALFENPRITQLLGDSFDVVEQMDSSTFTRIIHDPPVFSLAGHLYSGDFYRELYRLLRNRGLLFHYVGDPESKSGRSVTAGVIRRLEQAGFRQVRRTPRAFGVVALK
ncbi:MAG: methyltransferase [Anaerolineales bacterium]|nr:methyltransferase [Anaerolineales bacterium]